MKRSLQSVVVLLSIVLLTACTLSPAAAIRLVNESYLVVRADEVVIEQIEALDAAGTVIASYPL